MASQSVQSVSQTAGQGINGGADDPSVDPDEAVLKRRAEQTAASLAKLGLPKEALPRHIAIIMDGNGRWAKARGLPRKAGHQQGVEAVRRLVRPWAERLCGDW